MSKSSRVFLRSYFLLALAMVQAIAAPALAGGGNPGFQDDNSDVNALFSKWDLALKHDPMSPENHIGLAKAMQQRGNFQDAAREFRMAKQLSPNHRNAEAEKLLAGLGAAESAWNMQHHIKGVGKRDYALGDESTAEKFRKPNPIDAQAKERMLEQGQTEPKSPSDTGKFGP